MKKLHLPVLFFLVFPLFLMLSSTGLRAQVITITQPVYTYTQNFDSLASSGTSSKLPYGWYMYETGSAANTTYTADSGASSTGDTYSYGHKGSTDRSLGSLATNSEQSYIGAEFENQTGYSINSITVSYTVEQWRLGATGRQDSMPASVTTYASNLYLGFWVSLPILSIKSPVTSGTTGQLDGKAAANRKKFSFTIAGIAVGNGSSIWIRWQDANISGPNDGLAIDDFSLSVKAYVPHTIRSSKFPQATGIPDTTQTGLWKGIVLGQNFAPGGLYFQFKDNTGSITAISAGKSYGYTPGAGDSVAVYGQIKSRNYLTYIDIDSVGYIGSGYGTGIPKVVTDINNDTLESGLAQINNMNLPPGYKWDTIGGYKNSGFMTTMTNGTQTYNVWISNTSTLYTSLPPKFPFNLIGIVLQNGTTPTSGYFIWPRTNADIDTILLPIYRISQVRPQNTITGVADSANTGHLLYLKGVVQSPDFLTSGLEFSLADNTGSIMATSSYVGNYTPIEGDSVLVRGVIAQDNGLTEIVTDSIRKLPKGTGMLPAPIISTSLVETYESRIVKFLKATIVDSTKWLPSGTSFTVKYTDGIDTIDVTIFDNTDLFQMKHAPQGKFNITGIEGQSDPSSPYLSGYQLYPRGFGDYEKILPFAPIPLYKINSLKGYNAGTGVADSLNKGHGYIKGVVHSNSFSSSALDFALIDNTGAITVFSNVIKYYTPAIGDSLLIHGTVTQINGLTEFTADTIISLTKGSWLQTPAVVTKLNEGTESNLVKINDVYLTNAAEWKASGTGFTVHITNGPDTFLMLINSTIDLYSMSPLIGHFNVTGIATQNDPAAPCLSDYMIQPRGLFDIQHVLQLYKIRDVRVQSPSTGIADSATSKYAFYLKGIVQSPDFVTSGLQFSIKDSTGSIFIVSTSTVNNYTPVVGDSIFVRGLVIQANGLTEVKVDSISRLKNASPLLVPSVVTTLNETTEANLLKFNSAWLVDPTQWAVSGVGFNAQVTNGKDTIILYISNATNLFHITPPKGKFNVIGIGSQSTTSLPYFGGYFLMPGSIADINYLPVHLYSIGSVRPYDLVTGVADSIGTYCFLTGIVLSNNISWNVSSLLFSIRDATGAISVTYTGLTSYSPVVGDSIVVRGTVKQISGLTTFDEDSISKISSGHIDDNAVVVSDINESNESNLVELTSVTLKDSVGWSRNFAANAYAKAYNNTAGDTVLIQISSGTDIYNLSGLRAGNFSIIGIVLQEDATEPYFSDYVIVPRQIMDISYSGISEQKELADYVKLYPNPAKDNLILTATFKMDKVNITDMIGRTVESVIPDSDEYKINLSQLKPGVYIVRIDNCDTSVYKKIVKD